MHWQYYLIFVEVYMLDDILLQVRKPARYIGGEWNLRPKPFEKANIKFALCFPDLYELAMSNLGVRIIYGILNGIDDVVCERIFSPDADLEKILREGREVLPSLESRKGLCDFDMAGFSLSYELSYTNVLNILELSGVPLRASLRDHNYPIIIGGGPCTLNPEPMHEFFDLFFVGEAEDALSQLIDIYRKSKGEFKKGRLSKEELLIAFSSIEGVYVPSLYKVSYAPDGKIERFEPKIGGVPARIKKRVVNDLDRAFFPVDWLVPYIQIVHDRIAVEVMRGCPNSCRFCQARAQYYPYRVRQSQSVLKIISQIYKCTGYEEVSLLGLSVSDYYDIEGILKTLVDTFSDRAVGVSLPSMRHKANTGSLSALIASVRKTGLTFAPEAATEKLRNIIGKNFDEPVFFNTLEHIYASGYQHIKLYFMIGLPQETDRDLDAIIDFGQRASLLRKKTTSLGSASVNISINTLIPKSHTPMQWHGFQSSADTEKKENYLRGMVKGRKLKLVFQDRRMGFLEAVLSRGDRRLSPAIESSFKRGARFDAWTDRFRFDLWQASFLEHGIDASAYLRQRHTTEFLPWDFLDMGISKDWLISEYQKTI